MRPKYYKNYYTNGAGAIPGPTLRRWNERDVLNGNRNPLTENFEAVNVEMTECNNYEENSNVSNECIADTSDIDSIRGNLHVPSVESFTSSEEHSSYSDDSVNNISFENENVNDWLSKKLYSTGEITVGEAIHEILSFFVRNALTKKCLSELLLLLNYFLPKPNNLPVTKYHFFKLLFSLLPPHDDIVKKHQICEDCQQYLGCISENESKLSCDNCGSSNTGGYFIEYNLKHVLKDAFETRHLADLIRLHKSNLNNDENYISDFLSGSEYRHLQNHLRGEFDLCLLWNTDGTPVSKSSKGQIWPVQVQILNIPPQNRRNFQFLVGIYYSTVQHPNMNGFLKPLSIMMKDLFKNGLDWYDDSKNEMMHSIVIAPIATLDCPARAAVQNIMQYNGEYGCTFCEHPGFTSATGAGHNRIFPALSQNAPLRTAEKMIQQGDTAISNNLKHVKGVKGITIAATIPHFDIANSFVPDYMHAVLAGVTKMLMVSWLDSNNKDKLYYITKANQKKIDKIILNISPPDFICRTPRSLKHLHYFTAKEIRDYLLYYFPIVLKDVLPRKYYEHFLLLFYGIRILLQSNIHTNEISLAEIVLELFARNVENLYGIQKCSYNVHQLTHLANSVSKWGPLWVWSTFPFEDANGYFKKINHGQNKVDVEIINTIKILNAFYILRNKVTPNVLEQYSIVQVLGAIKKVELNLHEIEGLHELVASNTVSINNNNILAYTRLQKNKEIFTSQIYLRQKKRNNSVISWNKMRNFGRIKCFIYANDNIYAFVQELVRNYVQPHFIHVQIKVDLHQIIIPVRLTFNYLAIPINQIDGKLLYINDCICLPPNLYEKKL